MHSFEKRLAKRYEDGSIRSLSLLRQFVDFFSNDYLGLSRFPSSQTKSKKRYSSTGSRLLSGNSVEAENCEVFLAEYFESEAALVFNSGYDANLGFFSSIPQKGDTIIYDALIHASVRDGIRLSYADSFSFKHNDILDLELKIQRAKGTIFVAIESLYSMDGDCAPIQEISRICKDKNAFLIVDEAHACGVLGENGKGLSLPYSPFARLITFGKAYGSHGAAILSTSLVKTYLINFARSFIYTTALPNESYDRIQSILKNSNQNKLREILLENIHVFRGEFSEYLLSDSQSPIQIIPCPGVKKAIDLCSIIQENGFAVKPILSPTVPLGSERIRICLHSFNTPDQIKGLVATLRS
jgi:8-amino-7-oxononanoate synthase